MKKNHIVIISVAAVVVALAFLFSIMNGQKSLATKSARTTVSNPSVPAAVPPAANNQPEGQQTTAQTETPAVQKLPEKKDSGATASKLPDAPRTVKAYRVPQTQERTGSLRGKGEVAPAVETPAENHNPKEIKTIEAASTQPIKVASNTVQAENNDIQKVRIAADVAAKRPMRDIINEACKAGMSVDEVVGCMIKSGADARSVVYVAISEGYSRDKVVRGAIKADAPLDTIMNAGMSAGADSKELCRAAIDAGVFPSACASAVSFSGASEAPVYGYSSPTDAPQPTMYAPVAPVVVGGGGGGGFTKKASPHKP